MLIVDQLGRCRCGCTICLCLYVLTVCWALLANGSICANMLTVRAFNVDEIDEEVVSAVE